MILYGLALVLVAISGLPGFFFQEKGHLLSPLILGLGALSGLTAAIWVLLGGAAWTMPILANPLGTQGLLHFDATAAFFLIPVLLIPLCGSIYGITYWDNHHESAPRVRLLYGILTAFLALLVAASHAFTFLLAWEGMAIAAFFLVITEDREADTQRAGWIYLIATHSGTLCLFAAFALLASVTGSFLFKALPPGLAASPKGTVIFLLFLAGFSCKAGVFPLHFWLPPAHAAAPSHVSSFMSGVLIKMGILGLIRMISWIPDPPFWWGGLLVALGCISGIMGVAMALGQHDLKRLLAYHSIENIGIILIGLGIGLLGKAAGQPVIETLGFAGGILHVLNHGLFKGLLFLAAGSVVKATGTRDLEKLGGLSHTMPKTSLAFLTGAWGICGLPPLNGFVSEWLIYLAAFSGLALVGSGWPILSLAALALIGALALACFAKAFGTVFLGHPRSPEAAQAKESPQSMGFPMAILALGCALVGLFPFLLAPSLDRVLGCVHGEGQLPALSPLTNLPILSLLAIPLLLIAWVLWRWVRRPAANRDLPTWDCGYLAGTPRMQYTASSFADSLVSGMRWILWPQKSWRRIHATFPTQAHFESHLPDPVLDRLASPLLLRIAGKLALLRFFQGGHLPIYLLYVLLTLIVLLIWTVA